MNFDQWLNARLDEEILIKWAQAIRATVAQHEESDRGECLTCRAADGDEWSNEQYPCTTLRHIAFVYADHRDCRPEWVAQ